MLLVLGFALGAGPADAALINGRNYVALGDWARASGLSAAWARRGAEILVTNRTTRLLFDVDSAQAQINGVNVRLSFPVANVKGTPFIAQLDVDKTLRPLLYPAGYLQPKKIITICLDPGHGGRDSGNRVGGLFFGHSEKTYTLALALELRDQLQRAGFKVILTRNKDVYPELPARPALANKLGADLFVSLHFNATQSGRNSVEGPETYCITPVGASSSNAQGEGGGSGATVANLYGNQSLLFAYQVQKAVVQYLRADDRGVRRARFAVLRDAAMPAILIEGGYMTHPDEGKKIFDAAYRKRMATAIVQGILSYQKLAAPMVAAKTNPAGTNKGSGAKKSK